MCGARPPTINSRSQLALRSTIGTAAHRSFARILFRGRTRDAEAAARGSSGKPGRCFATTRSDQRIMNFAPDYGFKINGKPYPSGHRHALFSIFVTPHDFRRGKYGSPMKWGAFQD